MKYTPEEIRDCIHGLRTAVEDDTAAMLEDMLEVVEALSKIEPALQRFAKHHNPKLDSTQIFLYAPTSNIRSEPSISLQDVLDLVATLAPFDFSKGEDCDDAP